MLVVRFLRTSLPGELAPWAFLCVKSFQPRTAAAAEVVEAGQLTAKLALHCQATEEQAAAVVEVVGLAARQVQPHCWNTVEGAAEVVEEEEGDKARWQKSELAEVVEVAGEEEEEVTMTEP